MKHTEIPGAMDDKKISLVDNENPERILEIGDKVIYAAIRRYMNHESRECFPSIQKIKEKTKCGQAKINKAIDRLIRAGFIVKNKRLAPNGKISNFYYFPKSKLDDHFERFTDAFLDLDIPINVKEYYMDIQKYLYYDEASKMGKCSFNNSEIARRLGISTPTVKKYNTYLIENGFLSEEVSNSTDEAGLPIITKNFDLVNLNQADLWAVFITKQTFDNTESIEVLQEKYNTLETSHNKLEKEVASLRKALALQNNKTEPEQTYDF